MLTEFYMAGNSHLDSIPLERKEQLLKYLPSYLYDAGMFDKLTSLLLDIGFIEEKIVYTGVKAVLDDFHLVDTSGKDSVTTALELVINQNQHSLIRCRSRAEVLGILLSYAFAFPDLMELLEKHASASPESYLRAVYAPANIPTVALRRNFAREFKYNRETTGPSICDISSTGRIIHMNYAGLVRVWNTLDGGLLFEKLCVDGSLFEPLFPSCSISEDGSLIIFRASSKHFEVWDIDRGKKRTDVSALGDEKSAQFRFCHLTHDGRYVVLASDSISLYCSKAGTHWFTLPNAREKGVYNLEHTVAPANNVISAVTTNNTIGVWDIAAKSLVFESHEHQWPLICLRFSQCGQYIVSVSTNERNRLMKSKNLPLDPAQSTSSIVQVWNAADGSILQTLEYDTPVSQAAFVPDNQHLIVLFFGGDTHVTKLEVGIEGGNIMTKEGLFLIANTTTLVSISPGSPPSGFKVEDGKFKLSAGNRWFSTSANYPANYLYMGTEFGDLLEYDTNHLLEPVTLQSITPIPGYITDDMVIIASDENSEDERRNLEHYWYKARAAVISLKPEKAILLAASADRNRYLYEAEGKIILWDEPSRRIVRNLSERDTNLSKIGLSYDGQYIASINLYREKGGLDVFDVITNQSLIYSKMGGYFRFCSANNHIVYTDYHGDKGSTPIIKVMDLTVGQVLFSLENKMEPGNSSSRHLFSSTGKYLVVLGRDAVRIIRTDNWELQQTINDVDGYREGDFGFNSVVMSPREDLVVTGASSGLGTINIGQADKTYKVWDCQSAQLCSVIQHEARLMACQFSPDGSRFATMSADGAIKVWNAENFDLLAALYTHDPPGNTCTFHPDGRYMVTGYSVDYLLNQRSIHRGQLNFLELRG